MPIDDRFYAGARVTSEGADPTHHIKLSDGVRTIGCVITDQAGDRAERTFRRFPHSDPAQPYVTEKQTSFGGGFGQSIFEDNRSKYWKSSGVDTMKDVLVLGPAFHHAKGTFVKAEENISYSDFHFFRVGVTGSSMWRGMPFTPSSQWTGTTYLKLFLKRKGNPANLRVRFYTDAGNNYPTALIHSVDFTPDNVTTDPQGDWVRLAVTDTYTYSAGTKYWVVLTTTGAGGGTWWVGCEAHSVGKRSADGTSWSATSAPDFFFRVYGDNDPMHARWIDYKQQTYAFLNWDNTSEAELWMNGWRGACDDNTGNLNSLLDSTDGGNWSSRITGDEVVKIVAGPASAEIDDFRLVTSAINGDITVSPDWIITHGVYDDYVVQNSDWFQQITAPTGYLSGYITDVAVAGGSMYIARAGKRGMVYHHENNLSGNYDKSSNWYVNPNVIGESIISMRDPIQGDQLWIGNNAKDMGDWKPYVYMTPPNLTYIAGGGTLNSQILCNSWGGSADGLYEYWESDVATNVVVSGGASRAQIKVYTARVDTVATTATGANYAVDDVLTLVDSGSSGTATVKVTAIDGSGQPTAYDVVAVGYDYTTGTKATTGGSGDGNATVNITALTTVSGLIAHIDFMDRTGTTRTVDLRHMTDLKFVMKFEVMVDGNYLTLSSTDVKINLDDTAGAASQFAQYNVPDMISNVGSDQARYITLDLDEVAGAEKCTSMGIEVTEQTNSYILTLVGPVQVWKDIEPVLVGQVDGDNITGLEVFGDPEQLWVFTEAGYGPIKNNRFLPVPNREIKTARHANNGRGHTVHDVYLLFTWKGRLQRYYRQNLEDLGPDFPEGMGDIAGEVVDVVTYPGRFYVAIDGGTNGKSMILCYKGGGWHEIYTSFTGERIRSLYVQAIEAKSDKLWASVGSDLMWFPIELQSADLPANTDYRYRPTGYLDTSWIYTSSRELDKAFRSVLLTVDAANDNDLDVLMYYQIDDANSSWVSLDTREAYSSSTIKYKLETFGQNAKGNRIRFRLELRSHVPTKTPKIRSYQARMFRMSEVKFSYTWLTKLSTISVNLRGDEEKVVGQYKTVQQAFDLIDTWAASLTPLKITSDIGAIHDKEVVIEPVPAQLLMIVHDEKIQEQSIQMQANDA